MGIQIVDEFGNYINVIYILSLNSPQNVNAMCYIGNTPPPQGSMVAQPVCPTLTWTTDRPDIVSLSYTTGTTNTITGLKNGTASVIVTGSDGTATSIIVDVTPISNTSKALVGLILVGGLIYIGYMGYELMIKK